MRENYLLLLLLFLLLLLLLLLLLFTPNYRAAIGRYAAEYGNAAVVKRYMYKTTHDIGESTVRPVTSDKRNN